MREETWYVRLGSGQMGPLSTDELQKMAQQGELKPTTQVSRDRSTWRDASSIGGLSFQRSGSSGGNVAREMGNWVGAGTRQARSVIDDFREMNFRKEIVPIDGSNVGLLANDFIFWAVAFLGVVPLLIVTLQNQHAQLTGFALFFAAMWGVIFKQFVVKQEASWKLPIAALFFTGIVGINLLLFVYHYLPKSFLDLATSKSQMTSLFGFIVQVGICEEFCKFLPVAIYGLWKRSQADPFMIVLIGVFSGLGFAAFENLDYGQRAVLGTLGLTIREGAEGLVSGVQGAMIFTMARSLSCVFTHAVWAGTFAYFLAMAFASGRRWVPLIVVGLCVPAVLHGAYDWFCTMQPTVAALIAGGSFMLFYGYLAKLKGMQEAS